MDAVVLGGGLVGYLMTILLAKAGWHVTVLEKYPDPRKKRPECVRSINLTLAVRGEDGLKAVNLLDTVKYDSMPAYGRVVYDGKGKEKSRSMYGEGGESIGSIGRFQLNLLLLNTAAAMENVNVHFCHELVTCDFAAGEVVVQETTAADNGKKVDKKFTADLFVGADGAHSAMRCEMMKQRKLELMEFKYHDHGYMEMSIPASDSGAHQMDKDMLHVFPKDTFTLICLPNPKGTFSGTLVMPYDLFDKALASPAALTDFFEEHFPRVYQMVGEKELIGQFKPGQDDRRSPCRLVSLKCQPYHVSGQTKSNFVLLGDAAHAMVPFYGQGMNTGFEDCLILMEKLEKHGWASQDTISKALEEFSAVRCQDGQAMADFSYGHYNALCQGVKNRNYSVRRHLDSILFRMFPESWVPEYTMIAFSRMPFSLCQKRCHQQSQIIRWATVCLIVIAFLLVALGCLLSLVC